MGGEGVTTRFFSTPAFALPILPQLLCLMQLCEKATFSPLCSSVGGLRLMSTSRFGGSFGLAQLAMTPPLDDTLGGSHHFIPLCGRREKQRALSINQIVKEQPGRTGTGTEFIGRV